jgi:hypothetical protein
MWCLAFLVVLLCAGVVVLVRPSPYDQIRVGMTLQEVDDLYGHAGDPLYQYSGVGGVTLVTERREGYWETVNVEYDADDRVYGKYKTYRAVDWWGWALEKVGLGNSALAPRPVLRYVPVPTRAIPHTETPVQATPP